MSHTYPLTPNHPPPLSKFKPFIPHVAKTAIDAIKAQQKDDEGAGVMGGCGVKAYHLHLILGGCLCVDEALTSSLIAHFLIVVAV